MLALIAMCSAKSRSKGAASELGARVSKTENRNKRTVKRLQRTQIHRKKGLSRAILEANWTTGE